jgi:hypothetical protein
VTWDPGTLDIHMGAVSDSVSLAYLSPNESSLKDQKEGKIVGFSELCIVSNSLERFSMGEETLKVKLSLGLVAKRVIRRFSFSTKSCVVY